MNKKMFTTLEFDKVLSMLEDLALSNNAKKEYKN